MEGIKTYLKLIRDEDGRWIGKSYPRTRWVLVVFGLILIGLLYAQIAYGQIERERNNPAVLRPAVLGQEQPRGEPPCIEVSEHHWDCSTGEDRWKWSQYLKTQNTELKKEVESLKGKVGIVTGYTSRVEETDASPCISADGSDICKRYAEGERICATNDYPMHATLKIEGLGTCIVRDRMNKRYTGTGRVDYYFGNDLASALSHGAKQYRIIIK